MAINRYDKPAQLQLMNTHVPLPYQEIMQGLMAKEKAQEAGIAGLIKIGNLETPALKLGNLEEGTDYERVVKAKEALDKRINTLTHMTDLTSPEGRRALLEFDRYATKAFSSKGIFGGAKANYAERAKIEEEYKKALYKKNGIKANQLQASLAKWDKDYHERGGVGKDSMSGWQQYQSNYIPTGVNMADKAMKYASEVEASLNASKHFSRYRNPQTGQMEEGYIFTDKRSQKQVSQEKILTTLLGADWENVLAGDINSIGGIVRGDQDMMNYLIDGMQKGYASPYELVQAMLGASIAKSFSETEREFNVKADQTWKFNQKNKLKDNDITQAETSVFLQTNNNLLNTTQEEGADVAHTNFIQDYNTEKNMLGAAIRNQQSLLDTFETNKEGEYINTEEAKAAQVAKQNIKDLKISLQILDEKRDKKYQTDKGILLESYREIYRKAKNNGLPKNTTFADFVSVIHSQHNKGKKYMEEVSYEDISEEIGVSLLNEDAKKEIYSVIQNTMGNVQEYIPGVAVPYYPYTIYKDVEDGDTDRWSVKGNTKSGIGAMVPGAGNNFMNLFTGAGIPQGGNLISRNNIVGSIDEALQRNYEKTYKNDLRSYGQLNFSNAFQTKNTPIKQEQDNIRNHPNQNAFYMLGEGNNLRDVDPRDFDINKGQIVGSIMTEDGMFWEYKVPTSSDKKTVVDTDKTVSDQVTTETSSAGRDNYQSIFVKPNNQAKAKNSVANALGGTITSPMSPNYGALLEYTSGPAQNLAVKFNQSISDLNTDEQKPITIDLKKEKIYIPSNLSTGEPMDLIKISRKQENFIVSFIKDNDVLEEAINFNTDYLKEILLKSTDLNSFVFKGGDSEIFQEQEEALVSGKRKIKKNN